MGFMVVNLLFAAANIAVGSWPGHLSIGNLVVGAINLFIAGLCCGGAMYRKALRG